MKLHFAVLLLLMSCGEKKEVVREVPAKTPVIKKVRNPTCTQDYVLTYVTLNQKLRVMNYIFETRDSTLEDKIDIALEAYYEFKSYLNVVSCTYLDRGELKTIITKDVLDKAIQNIRDVRGSLK